MPMIFKKTESITKPAHSAELVDIYIDTESMTAKLRFKLLDTNGEIVAVRGANETINLIDPNGNPNVSAKNIGVFSTALTAMKTLAYALAQQEGILPPGDIS